MSYRFQLPAALCVTIDADSRDEAERKAAALWGTILEAGRGYSIRLGCEAQTDGILWFDPEGKPQYLTELPDDDDEPDEPTQEYDCDTCGGSGCGECCPGIDPDDAADLPGTPEPWEKPAG